MKQQLLKTTFTSVNEKTKFIPAKEVNGFCIEGALQHPFGDDVSAYTRCAAALPLLTAIKADHLHKRTIARNTAQDGDSYYHAMQIATVRRIAIVKVVHGLSTKLT